MSTKFSMEGYYTAYKNIAVYNDYSITFFIYRFGWSSEQSLSVILQIFTSWDDHNWFAKRSWTGECCGMVNL